MTMPITAFGAPAAATPASTVGVSAFASPTTAPSAISSTPALIQAATRDGTGACVSSSAASGGRK